MKTTLKFLFNHFLMITTFVLFGTSLLNFFKTTNRSEPFYNIYFPLKVLMTGALCSIPSALFVYTKEPSKKQFWFRVVIHFIILTLLLIIIGKIFHFYKTFNQFMIVFSIEVFVYILVWICSSWTEQKTENSINKVLDDINKDE